MAPNGGQPVSKFCVFFKFLKQWLFPLFIVLIYAQFVLTAAQILPPTQAPDYEDETTTPPTPTPSSRRNQTTTNTTPKPSTNKTGRLKFGARNCTPQHFVDSQIYIQLNAEQAKRNTSNNSLCINDPPSPIPCDFQTLRANEWTVEAENLYMAMFMSRSDVCDFNLLLHCTQYIPQEGPHEWECLCRPYSASTIRKDNSTQGRCVALVGHPCEFRVATQYDPENMKLTGDGYTCGENAECIPPEDLSSGINNSMMQRVSDTVGYPTNDAWWPPPMIAFINRRIASVCACRRGFATNGDGICVPRSIAEKGAGSGSEDLGSNSSNLIGYLCFIFLNLAIFKEL